MSHLERMLAPENNLLEVMADHGARIERLERYPDTIGTGTARDDESFIVVELSDYLDNERRLQAGDGLTLTDDGANADITIAMGTPSTLTTLTENIVTGDTHYHAVETSSNPGATQVILATAEDGGVQLLRLGIGTDPDTDDAVKVADNVWIGLGAAAGRIILDSTPNPDQVQLAAADLYLPASHGVIHADGVTAGYVLQADGTRYVPADPTGSLPFAPTARGDMIAADATPAWARLAFPGAAGYALVTTATDPSWSLTPTWLDLHTFAAGLSLVEMAPPTPPAAANTAHIYAEESHGFTLLSFMDDTSMVRKIVRDSVIIVKNVTGVAIAKSRAVYASGSDGSVPTIALACADDPATMPAIGVTIESIAHNAFGRVMQTGLLENVDTSAFAVGNVLYVSAVVPGAPAIAIPPTPSLKQELGTVLVQSPPATTTGSVQIVARSTTQNETGTRQNTWRVGDAVAGAKSVTFLANFTGTLQWTPTAARVITLPDLTGTVALGADTLTVSTANDITVPDHTHAITASENPGAVTSILKSAADGGLQLLRLGIGADPDTNNRITMVDGGQIGQTNGPLLTFDDTNDLLEITGCKVGLGTATVPHGGVGVAMLALEGTNASTAGPHVQFTTASDDYPLMQILPLLHDNIGIQFDAYWDGTDTRSSDAGSNFLILKNTDQFQFRCSSGIAAGNVITWGIGLALDTARHACVGSNSFLAALTVIQGNASFGQPVLSLSQSDVDDTFIDFIGTSAADQTKSISTVNGDGAVDGPKDAAAAVGWTFVGMYRIDINGSVYWAPYYTTDSP